MIFCYWISDLPRILENDSTLESILHYYLVGVAQHKTGFPKKMMLAIGHRQFINAVQKSGARFNWQALPLPLLALRL